MNRIAPIPVANNFAAKTPLRSKPVIPSQASDSVYFGHKDKTHNHKEKKSWFSRKFASLKARFGKSHTHQAEHATDACTEKGCSHSHSWLGRQVHAIEHWFKNFREYIHEDFTRLHDWLARKFPNVIKRAAKA